jgi:hypothetical protein
MMSFNYFSNPIPVDSESYLLAITTGVQAIKLLKQFVKVRGPRATQKMVDKIHRFVEELDSDV